MTDPSPAARAAVLAFYEETSRLSRHRLAAALRALADHEHVTATGGPLDHWSPDERTRRELRNLAEELAGHG